MSLAGRRLVLVLGKGGVGRTTVASALGLAAAASGLETLVCEVGGEARLARLFGEAAAREPYTETPLAPRLHGLSIDPARSLEEFLLLQLPLGGITRRLAGDHAFSHLAAAAPGLRELVTIGKIWHLAEPGRQRLAQYDVVIADLPATGHGLAMLRAPATFADIAASGPLHRQSARVAHDLHDTSRTAAVVVALPEELPVNEAVGLTAALRRDRVRPALALANAVPARLLDRRAADALAAASPAGDEEAAAVAAAGARRGRADDRRAAEVDRLGAETGLETVVLPEIDPPSTRRDLAPLIEALRPTWR